MKDQIEETQNLRERLSKLENSPSIRELREAEEAATLERRREAARKIQRIHRETDEAAERVKTELAEAEAVMKVAQARHDEAVAAVRALAARRFALSNEHSRRLNREIEVLHTSYDSILDSEISFWNEKLADFRRMEPDWQTRRGGRNLINWKQKLLTFTNRPAIMRAIDYCRKTIELLEDMKLAPEVDQELLTRLRKSIPDVGEYEEVIGERKIEADAADTNAFSGVKSDSQLDWEIRKLDEKAERLKRRRKT